MLLTNEIKNNVFPSFLDMEKTSSKLELHKVYLYFLSPPLMVIGKWLGSMITMYLFSSNAIYSVITYNFISYL